MFCGKSSAFPTHTSSDTASHTLDLKLKLLSEFKKAKIPFSPDTPATRDIVKKVRGFYKIMISILRYPSEFSILYVVHGGLCIFK